MMSKNYKNCEKILKFTFKPTILNKLSFDFYIDYYISEYFIKTNNLHR